VYVRELSIEFAHPAHETLVLPGVMALLETLHRADDVVLGLLTGNIRDGATLKLASADIRTPFVVGAFGSDCDRRDGLPPLAVERARELTGRSFTNRDIVILGDTPSDVTCGRALGVRAIAVATGNFASAELHDAGADSVFADFTDTRSVVDAIMN
jgi:phosphoglycolate phosphatase-like HAD superfamily hydrolase